MNLHHSELKEFEAKVLHAEDRIHELEYQLPQKVLNGAGYARAEIHRRIARLMFQSLAEAASRYREVRPEINNEGIADLKEAVIRTENAPVISLSQ